MFRFHLHYKAYFHVASMQMITRVRQCLNWDIVDNSIYSNRIRKTSFIQKYQRSFSKFCTLIGACNIIYDNIYMWDKRWNRNSKIEKAFHFIWIFSYAYDGVMYLSKSQPWRQCIVQNLNVYNTRLGRLCYVHKTNLKTTSCP